MFVERRRFNLRRFCDLWGSAVVSTASVGVPPTESFSRNRSASTPQRFVILPNHPLTIRPYTLSVPPMSIVLHTILGRARLRRAVTRFPSPCTIPNSLFAPANPERIESFSPGLARFREGLPWVMALNRHSPARVESQLRGEIRGAIPSRPNQAPSGPIRPNQA